jgi:hypothetical protein
MIHAMDECEGAMDGAMDGSRSFRRNDEWCKLWMDQGAIQGVIWM